METGVWVGEFHSKERHDCTVNSFWQKCQDICCNLTTVNKISNLKRDNVGLSSSFGSKKKLTIFFRLRKNSFCIFSEFEAMSSKFEHLVHRR